MSYEITDPNIIFNDQFNPKEYSKILLNRWWCSYEGKPISYKVGRLNLYSPQCNTRKEIVEDICKDLYPWGEVIFLEKASVFLGFE